MPREPAVIRAVVVGVFAKREQERGDDTVDLDDAVVRGLRMQMAQPRRVERTEEVHRLGIELEDCREVGRRCVADQAELRGR